MKLLFVPGKDLPFKLCELSMELCSKIDEFGKSIVDSVSGISLVIRLSSMLEIRFKSLPCDLGRCVPKKFRKLISPRKTKISYSYNVLPELKYSRQNYFGYTPFTCTSLVVT